MPRTREENDRIRSAAKENILMSSMDIFIEQGYHTATIDDIAGKAGISKGLLYNYFKGKEDVLAEMVRLRIEEIAEVMDSAFQCNSPYDQLKSIVEGAIWNVEQRPKVFRFFTNLQTQPERDVVLAKYSRMLNRETEKQFDLQCEIFTRLGVTNPRLRSLYFSSCLQGAMLMVSMYPNQYPVQEIKKHLLDEFIPGHKSSPSND